MPPRISTLDLDERGKRVSPEPVELAHALEVFRRWLHVPDPGAVLAVLASVAANLLPGDPLWLLLVGPPGGGKSELLNAAGELDHVHPAATLTEPALLSGTPGKDREDGAKGGLLRVIGDFGIILCKDFGSVLSMNRDARAAVLAALREVYDGSWTRHVGTGGGRTMHWSGKVGLIAGCTPTIDRHHAVIGSMGERFVLFRLPEVDSSEQARRALAHAGHEHQMRSELAAAVAGLFKDGLPSQPLERTAGDDARLVSLATLVVRARSAVERDGYSREIELIPGSEAPTRLVVVLAQLLAGLDAIGVVRAQGWDVVTKAALDSIPAIRRDVMNALHTAEQLDTTAVGVAVNYPTNTTRRALQDLEAHGIADRESGDKGHPDKWSLTTFARLHYAAALGVPETSANGHQPGVPETSGSLLTPHHTYDDISGTVVAGASP
jgi:hypothetical protein